MKDVENVKVYHVDEYCEGASHFYFSERKDVVLLEDYKKLQDENKQLKADLEQARSHKHTIKMWNRNLHTENERLKAELEKDVTRKIFSEHCNSLQSEIKILEKRNAKLKCLNLLLLEMRYIFKANAINNNRTKFNTWVAWVNKASEFHKTYIKAKKEIRNKK